MQMADKQVTLRVLEGIDFLWIKAQSIVSDTDSMIDPKTFSKPAIVNPLIG